MLTMFGERVNLATVVTGPQGPFFTVTYCFLGPFHGNRTILKPVSKMWGRVKAHVTL
jgi:hypothetical protein